LDDTKAPPLVVPDGSGQRSGRGAYLCARRVCVDQAVRRRAFQRAFRRTVRVDEAGLVREIEERAQEHTR
jgi:uncharacterized protein